MSGETESQRPGEATSEFKSEPHAEPTPELATGQRTAARDPQGNPFAQLSGSAARPLLMRDSERREGAASESYSVRLSPEVRRRLLEAQAKAGAKSGEFIAELLDVHDEREGATAQALPERYARVRREAESLTRALMTTLTASLSEMAADETLLESEKSDLETALLAAREREAALATELTARRAEAVRAAADREAERALSASKVAAVSSELDDTKTTLRVLNETVGELREKLQEYAGQKERLQRAERERDEARTGAAHEARVREEAELKLARKVEDSERLRRQLAENEAMRARQQQMEEEERAVLKTRAAAECERLEATIDRLKERMGEMTRENGK